MSGKVTAAEVRAGLLNYYSQPENAVVFEVAQSTGFAANRRLDAVAMELWPSRGLALHGIEIKVDLHDWRREKANPEKAEEIARFCDTFWIAAPEGLVPVEELPSAWGLLELKGGRLGQRWPAKKTDAQPVDRAFLAALLRAAGRGIDPSSVEAVIDKRRRLLDAEFDMRVEVAAERKVGRRDKGAVSWQALLEAIGADHMSGLFMRDQEVIEAVRLVLRAGVTQTWTGVKGIADALSQADRKIQELLADLGVETEKPKRRAKRPGRAA